MSYRIAHSALIACTLTLAGCAATMGPVTPTDQPDQYTVTNRIVGHTVSWVELKRAAIERADQYCQSIGRRLTQPEVTSNHATGLRPQEAYVTFNCEPIAASKKPQGDATQ